ncbi:MAG: AbrB/MazE/SpoVT family DNA-binding domain-containing protein [Microbacterium sp.]|nr:MAG: AbrB/MazE/SpoVT family DNA-binding domain-containing protein [Microbacterium sp.]
MDKAGRIVIPSAIREQLGLVPGPVDLFVDGTGVRIEVDAHDELIERNGRLVVPGSGIPIDADDVRELRLAAQR